MKRIILLAVLLGLAACYCAGPVNAASLNYELILRAVKTPVSRCTLEEMSGKLPPYLERKKGGYVCFADDGDFTATFVELSEPAWGMEWVRGCLRFQSQCESEILPRPATRIVDLMRFSALRMEDWVGEAEQAANTDEGAGYAALMRQRYARAVSACKNTKQDKDEVLIWVGRVVASKIVFSAVSDSSAFAACFQQEMAAAVVPEPPVNPYYVRLGGHPVVFVKTQGTE